MIVLAVTYSSVSLSPTLDRNEKVEQHIRKKTHKPNALRFWVEGGVIPLYVGSCFILWDLSGVFPLGFSQQVVLELMVHLCRWTNGISLTLYWKFSWWRFQANVSRIGVWTTVQVRTLS